MDYLEVEQILLGLIIYAILFVVLYYAIKQLNKMIRSKRKALYQFAVDND